MVSVFAPQPSRILMPMTTRGPNLFDHATSELSQDAALCWCIAWADSRYAATDPAMHAIGRDLVASMYDTAKAEAPGGDYSVRRALPAVRRCAVAPRRCTAPAAPPSAAPRRCARAAAPRRCPQRHAEADSDAPQRHGAADSDATQRHAAARLAIWSSGRTATRPWPQALPEDATRPQSRMHR